ncbi:MAG: helix-turn-helix transcriptional regulator [candidate division Zixibacteria bacterium]|nr:helix-turn-helix transcriptional regulator [candidate division Zixibacteria bacterium]
MNNAEFRARRLQLRLSQMDAARLSGIDRSTISRFEKHGITLSEAQLQRLEAALNFHRPTDPVPINQLERRQS